MKLPRRRFLHLAAGAAALPAVSRFANAQSYPSRPVRIIAPTAPGGGPDILARLIGPWLSGRLGQQFVIENRPGGGSNIGTEAVVKSPPGGYTLLLATTTNTINATLYDKLNFVFLRDIPPVAGIISLPFVMVANPSVPAKTVPEFTAYAKANPGKISVGSPGIGTPGHVAGELFKMMAGVEMIHVPYRGGGAVLSDLLGGQVQVFGAPKKTPVQIIDKLNREINAALDDPKLKTRLVDLGGTLLAGSPADFGKLIADDTEKWAKVIRAANIKAD